MPLFVIGRGSNLLVRDGGIRGVVVHPCGGEFERIDVSGNEITAGVGAKQKEIAYAGKAAGIGGFEWMEGIPGDVGGALRMNAGAMGGADFRERRERALSRSSDGNAHVKTPAEMDVHYRHVGTLEKNYAVSAVFGNTAHGGGDRAEARCIAGEAPHHAAGGQERGLHLQESRADSRGQTGR